MSNFWTFRTRELKPDEQWRRPGKPEYHDYVSIFLNRSDVINLLALLATQLRNHQGDDDHYQVELYGKLYKSEE